MKTEHSDDIRSKKTINDALITALNILTEGGIQASVTVEVDGRKHFAGNWDMFQGKPK